MWLNHCHKYLMNRIIINLTRILGISTVLFSFSDTCSAQFTFYSGMANTSKSGQKEVRLLGEVTTSSELGNFGGNKKSKMEATGFFKLKQIEGVWYLIDPEGYRFFTIGVNSVSKGGGVILPDALRDIGTNTLGCWSDETINDEADHKMPYCPRWNFMTTYKNSAQRTKDLYNDGIIPVFDPGFIGFCDNHAGQLEALKDDPWLLGHFSDNELPVYDNTTYGNLLDRFLAIADKSDPNYLAAHNWMVSRKGSGYQVSVDDREPFHGYVTGSYYRIVSEAIKRYDPNHLYLGSRLHGGAKSKPSIFQEAAKYVDMISINVYSVWTPARKDMDMWSSGGKPFFVTEFYAKAEDSGLPNEGGAGWLVPAQEDRAKFFENFVLALVEHPGCVGYHYFRYIDDGEANKGLLDGNYNWYELLRNSFYKIARDVYSLRDFMIHGSASGFLNREIPLKPKIYPNPCSGGFYIGSIGSGINPDVGIFTEEGKKIISFKSVSLPFFVETGHFIKGLYILKLCSGNSGYSEKIIKY